MSDFLNQALNGAKRAYGVASDAVGGVMDSAKNMLPGKGTYIPDTAGAGTMSQTASGQYQWKPTIESIEEGPAARAGKLSRLASGVNTALGVADVVHNAGAAAHDFSSGDPYKLSGHFLAGASNFIPGFQGTKAVGRTTDLLGAANGRDLGDIVGSGMHKLDQFMADTFGNERAKTRLMMAGDPLKNAPQVVPQPPQQPQPPQPPQQPQVQSEATQSGATKSAAPAEAPETPQAPTRQLTPAENFAYKKVIDNGDLAAQDMPRGTGIITSSSGRGTYINSNANPTLSKAANSTAGSSDSGGTPRSHTEQVMDFIKDPNRPRMNVAALNSLMQGAIAADTNSVARSRLDLEARRFGAEADDKHYDEMMKLATAKPIQQIDEHGKITNVPDDVGTDMIRHGLEQDLGGEWARKLWAMPAGDRAALVAKYRNGIDQTKAANKYASDTAYGVTLDTAPKNLRQRSVGLNDLINPFQTGGMKMSDAWATALNPFLWGDTVTDVQGPIVNDKGETHIGTVQSIPTKKLMENMGGINLSTINDINASKALNKAKETK